MLNWNRADLAKRSGVSERALADFEAELSKLMRANWQVVRQTFEQAGIEFTEGGGVRLNRQSR
jgi:hypothetical protein